MGGGGGGCGDFCCITHCGFCCVFKCSDCGDCCVGHCSGDCGGTRVSSGGGGGCSDYQEDRQTKHAATIANELAEMKARSTTDAKREEDAILKDINETMDEFIDWLQKVNSQPYGGRALNINIAKINELNDELRGAVIGSIGKYLDEKLVMTDENVKNILSETNDRKRKKNFDNFYQQTLRDAIRKLIKIIEDSVQKQSESIEHEIQNRINEVRQSMTAETDAFEELQQIKQQKNSGMAEKRVEYMYYENLCDIMFDQLRISGIKR